MDAQNLSNLSKEMLAILDKLKTPSKYILQTYCDVAKNIPQDSYYIVGVQGLVSLLEVDQERAGRLIRQIVQKRDYWYYNEIEFIIKRLKDYNLSVLCMEILNILYYDKKVISMKQYKDLEGLVN